MIHLHGHWARGTAVLAAFAFWSPGGLAVAQDSTSAPATTQPAATSKEDTGGGIKSRTSRPGAFDVDFQDTDIRTAFRLLSTQGNRNIIATREVIGKVTAVLYDVTFQEALESVLRYSGYAYVEKGNVIHVMTAKQKEDSEKAERQMKVEAFKLSYITAADAKTLLAPVLSPDGTMSTTPVSAQGIAESKVAAGGNAHASEDVLVIRDYEDRLKRIREILNELDVKPDQVLIEATILKCKLTEDNSLGINFNVLSGISFEHHGTIDQIRTDFTLAAGGITIGFTSNELTALLHALESITDTTILANPKLLVVNKQRGEVMVGNREGYLTTTVTETVATQTVQFLETGTRLVVRPFIGKDGFIRLEIHPEDSSGSVRPVGNNVLPSESTTEVTSNVLVRDGHTIIIGGLFRELTTNARSQVPLLGNIPYLGTVFRSTTDNTQRDEVIILITPRIIKQAADEAVGEQLKDDVERFRIGQRKGLQWFGRDRLAQSYMRWAKQALNDGRHDWALWCIDLALSLQPRMEEAIRLKERLTGTAYWSGESQESAAKYVIQRMMMQEMGKPVEQIIPPGKPRDADAVDPEVRKAFGIEKRPETPLPPPRVKKGSKPKSTTLPAGQDGKGEDK